MVYCDTTASQHVGSGERLHSSYFHPTLRTWQSNHHLTKENLMYPLFIVEDDDAKEEIATLPGQYRWGINSLINHLKPLVHQGLRSILLFGVVESARKDPAGSYADDLRNPVVRVLPKLRAEFPALLIACDVCLCPYTDHGHCGLLTGDKIDNEASIQRIASISVVYAQAGAHIIAPSDMMDNRIAAIDAALSSNKLRGNVSIMSYSCKFASCFYGPFRDAAKSSPQFGDRQSYQLPVNARGLAIRAAERDLREGADILMVKPAGPFLDIVRDVSIAHPQIALAVYQVSGEYASLYHASKAGAMDLNRAILETVNGFMRAGARIIISYFTPELLLLL